MNLSLKTIADPAAHRCSCLVLPVFEEGKLPLATAAVNKVCNGRITKLVKSEHFSGAPGKSVLLHAPAGVAAERVLLIGAGKAQGSDPGGFRKMISHAFSALKTTGSSDAVFMLSDVDTIGRDALWQVQQLGLLAATGDYRYTRTLSRPEPGQPPEPRRGGFEQAVQRQGHARDGTRVGRGWCDRRRHEHDT